MAGKTKKTNMYLFTETTYVKEKELNKLHKHLEKAEKIGKDTIS